MDKKRRNGGVASSVTCLNSLDFFLWGCMRSRVFHGSKPEARQQVVECRVEGAAGTQKEREQKIEQRLVECIVSQGANIYCHKVLIYTVTMC
jgi:hypothetical protein